MKSKSKKRSLRGRTFSQRKALTLAVVSVALGMAGGVWAQAVTGTIHGKVPVAPGEAVQITGGAGFNRTVTIGPSGKYSVTLPIGTYTVTLLQNGKAIQSHAGVSPVAAGAVTVNFTSSAATTNAQTLAAVNVSAAAIPPIDVSTTNEVTTITAKQLQQLPLARTAQSIAMLAPGVAPAPSTLPGGPLGNSLLSFGGASDAENAYYVDGMNTIDEITHQGGVTLPYGAIAEQQTMTSGYGARYGRSIGGVINQIGKSGTNQWHFGFKAQWEPASWRAKTRNTLWNNSLYRGPNLNQVAGKLNTYRKGNSEQETVYDAYLGGPIVKNKLTFFLAAEQDNLSGNSTGPITSPFTTAYQIHRPKVYAKVNWNINENNILSITGIQNSNKEWQGNYNFDYSSLTRGAFSARPLTSKTSFRVFVINYTSYITNNLTMHALFGKMHGEYYTQQPSYSGFDPNLPAITGASQQNPAFTPDGPIVNSQTTTQIPNPNEHDTVTNYRLSFDYKWGSNNFIFGIDNVQTTLEDEGTTTSGPGYSWSYGKGDPGTYIVGTNPDVPPWAGAPNANAAGAGGYYVLKSIYNVISAPHVSQRAQYIEDKWQVTPRLLLDLGLRNDEFINYNAAGQPFAKFTKPQWAPRLGFSWDVHGDSTFKVYGNAGRYYLSLPASTVASPALITEQPFTYTGINSLGIPIGLQPIPVNNGGHGDIGVSTNNDYGQIPNPKIAIARNIHAEYSDNFVLGIKQAFHMLHSTYVFGAEGMLQQMGPYITDDWDDMTALCEAALQQGIAYSGTSLGAQVSDCLQGANSSVIINPTRTAKILIPDGSGKLQEVVASDEVQGFTRKTSRKFYALNLSLTHPFDGKWFGKVVYTWSRAYGNTEGPTDADDGQGGFSVGRTAEWDFWQIMEGAYGVLPQNHTNQLKAYGVYQVDPEWQVGGNLYIASGSPLVCMGLFGPAQSNPVGYTNLYHWCGGHIMNPGSIGSTPWVHELALNVNYSPSWGDHRLNFNLSVFNVFNNQTVLQFSPSFGSTGSPNPGFKLPGATTPPRMFRFYVDYNF